MLEIGCGSGHILAAVKGREKHGVDLSQRMIARDQQILPDGLFQEVIRALPAPLCIKMVPSRLCPVHIVAAWER